MCGIIGYIGKRNAVSVILEGLKRLEYRGYDSAGIAFFSGKGIEVRRCTGKIKELASILGNESPSSTTAIGHTRWATHGKPSDENAHPHRSKSIVLVHNGIIENYLDLKEKLIEKLARSISGPSGTPPMVSHHRSGTGEALRDAVREAL